jgi:ATP-dependent DNA helicase PIF1
VLTSKLPPLTIHGSTSTALALARKSGHNVLMSEISNETVQSTPEFEAALDFVREGDGHLFVTGRAGTGKSTLLRLIRDELAEEAVVVAPTGLAAVNVGGQTIHSFFGFPPRLIQPDDIRRSRNGRIMRRMRFLIIDEVSMVRSDLMWAIDQSLRVNRGRAREPFGGVRLILFGDLHQLPPVVRGAEEAQHLEETYGGPFFFSVPALTEGAGTHLIELNRVFRQTDDTLVDVLNAIRDGNAGTREIEILNGCVRPITKLSEGREFVILTPTNEAANRINRAYLDALEGDEYAYQAGVVGEFNDKAQPTDAILVLKEGAKVMLLRNDADGRWVNGTIAEVSKLGDDRIWVSINGREHEVEQASWENRRYAFDQTQDKIVETVAGTFKQFPLRLAWALTIHKSQGLTLEKVYVDFGRGTFAHGQAYVALSRCRDLEGLTLARALRDRDILFDSGATRYQALFPAVLEPKGRISGDDPARH